MFIVRNYKTDKKPVISGSLSEEQKSARKKVYEALKKADEVYTRTFAFNTLIAACMEALNELNKIDNKDIYTEGYWIITNILGPIVPHIASEIANNLFNLNNFWKLEIDEDALKDDEITILEMTERFMGFCKESQGFIII